MDRPVLSSKEVQLTQEVDEVVELADNLSLKAKVKNPRDRDYLNAMLALSRTFSWLDSLLKGMGVSPKQWRHHLKNNPMPSPGEDSHLFADATSLLVAEKGTAKGQIELEHLFKALFNSNDPLVKQLFQASQVTPQRVEQAIQAMQPKTNQRRFLFFLRETLEVVVVVLFFLIVIKEGLGELRLIPSESMVPTLQIEDRVVIEKVTRWWRPYQRGDILVFYPPMTQLKQDPFSIFLRLTGFSGILYKKEDNIDVAYIKRLIALPGDTVDVKPGLGVFVNGKLLKEPYIEETALSCTQEQPTEICAPLTVPKDAYFMMGDNRNKSADSRFWGFEPKSRVIGRAVFRVWPFSRLGAISEPSYKESSH